MENIFGSRAPVISLFFKIYDIFNIKKYENEAEHSVLTYKHAKFYYDILCIVGYISITKSNKNL
jgi:hypothetical protein